MDMVYDKTGKMIEPRSRLFAWLVRHSAYILGAFAVRREGTTPYRALNGVEPSVKLAMFGEVVLFQDGGDRGARQILAQVA